MDELGKYFRIYIYIYIWSFTVSKTGKGNKILINLIVELIKVFSCVDAVFKLLHVESSNKVY